MEFPIAVLAFAVLVLLAGLVGGDLSYSGLVVPKVGPLPRFSTTLAGLALILLSLCVHAAGTGMPSDAPPTATAGAGVTVAAGPAELVEPVGPVEPAVPAVTVEPVQPVRPVQPVVVTVVDELAPWQAAEQVEVWVDGTHVGALSIDGSAPTASLAVPLEGPGSMDYQVAVDGVTVLGHSYSAHGAATVDVQDGSTLQLALDLTAGTAVLARRSSVG